MFLCPHYTIHSPPVIPLLLPPKLLEAKSATEELRTVYKVIQALILNNDIPLAGIRLWSFAGLFLYVRIVFPLLPL